MNKNKRNKKQAKESSKQAVPLDALQQLNLNAGGVDIGSEEIYVAVPPGRAEQSVRSFGVFTPELQSLAAWLVGCQVTTVAMEATGIYWIALYDILEASGIEVYLVNAHHAKNVAGRKTDVLDCQWLQQLHTYGLLRASFRPSGEIRALRSLVRQREMLIHYRSAHIQHMQKAMREMNVQLDVVLSDITGVTGMSIIRAIVAGNHDPKHLATYRDPGCKRTQSEIEKALMGTYSTELLFNLKQALALYDTYSQQIKDCDSELQKRYATLTQANDISVADLPPPTRRQQRNASKVDFDLRTQLYQMTGVDLTAIDGLGILSVQTILAEIGLDLSKWPALKHFCAWLGLAPHDDISGGKVLRHKTKTVKSRANLAFRQAAQSAAKTQTALGVFYRRIQAKHGTPSAVVATAHKLARIFYSMLKTRTPYRPEELDKLNDQPSPSLIRNLRPKAKKLGFQLLPA